MGVYEGGFECPPGKGVGCKSISEVNHMIDLNKPDLTPQIWFNPNVDDTECSNCSPKQKSKELGIFDAKRSI